VPPASSHLVRLTITAAAVLAVLPACGGAAAPAADDGAAATAEAAPPAVSEEEFEALSTRVLELELRVRNLQAAGATGDPMVAPVGEAGEAGESAEWNYDDPTTWGATCSTGTEQSPIDLSVGASVAADIANPVVDYLDTGAATIIDTGHTVEVGVEGSGTLALEGEAYDLKHLHFHAPSEHTVDGEHAPLEVHFVHETVEGAIAVVSALVAAGDPAPGYEPIVRALPADDAEHEVGALIALRSLLPEQTTAYRYRGSLTTPPCTEGVSWLVLTTPVTMSQAQIDAIVASLPAPNNRPTQDLDARVVGVDVTP
jgi:carbonic anhydrase